MVNMERLEDIIKKLPPELQEEVEDFVIFLSERKVKKKRKFLRQDWGGALRNYRNIYTSLDLQKKSLEWRED
jgi:hypothetical protein